MGTGGGKPLLLGDPNNRFSLPAADLEQTTENDKKIHRHPTDNGGKLVGQPARQKRLLGRGFDFTTCYSLWSGPDARAALSSRRRAHLNGHEKKCLKRWRDLRAGNAVL
ncbi:hypothetical protein Bbelb_228490 [Branchiostoma belcheri]|nr:hypothetical protein Bbelb_228490 [Branchiostoma belcheri]